MDSNTNLEAQPVGRTRIRGGEVAKLDRPRGVLQSDLSSLRWHGAAMEVPARLPACDGEQEAALATAS